MPNPFETPAFDQPKRHGLRERAIRAPTVGPGDKALQRRAEWMVDELRVQKYLAPKITFKQPVTGRFNLERNNVERGVNVLCVSAGKGHEMDEIDQLLPGSTVVGFDPHDFFDRARR